MEELGRHQSLHSVLDVFEALQGGERGVSEISRTVGMGKSGVHKILRNLEERGYVRSTRDKKYQLGLRLWQLGVAAVSDLDIRHAALPHMEKLTDLLGEGSLLSVYDKGEVVYLEKVTSSQPVVTTTHVGGRSPAFCSATGKAILAWQSEDEIDSVLSGPLERFNENTETDPDAIRADLAEVRRRGFAVNRGAWRGEIYGIGCPIRDHSGVAIAAVGVTGPAYRFGVDAVLEDAAAYLVVTAADISRDLGWNASE